MTDHEDDVAQAWDEEKSRIMESLLGKEHDMVMHAIIPYAVGGGLDLYYYPHGIRGTGIATKELSEAPGQGSKNRAFECYELVMFTRLPLSMDDALKPETPFGKAHENINAVLNIIAPYSAEATLNPCETCEFPEDMEEVGGKCFIFDCYGDPPKKKKWFGLGGSVAPFGLLLVIEIFPVEMNYARKHGGAALIEKLKAAGHYPCSDRNRDPVV